MAPNEGNLHMYSNVLSLIEYILYNFIKLERIGGLPTTLVCVSKKCCPATVFVNSKNRKSTNSNLTLNLDDAI